MLKEKEKILKEKTKDQNNMKRELTANSDNYAEQFQQVQEEFAH